MRPVFGLSIRAMQNLDFRTACVIYFCSHICIVVLLLVTFSDKRARGARLWIAGIVAQILAVPLYGLRGQIPDLASIILANSFFTLAVVCFWASFDVFFGNRRPHWRYGLPLAMATLLCVVFAEDVKVRSLLLSILFAALNWNIAWVVLRRMREFTWQAIAVLGAGYALAGCSYMVRGLALWFSPLPNPQPFAPGPAQDVAIVLAIPSLMACTLGFVLLHRDRAERDVRLMAESDHLTGLQNRRGFEAAFARELRAAACGPGWTSLALIDIDHFKRVNDRHGHALGDEALRRLALIVKTELRDNDIVARIGGDEFCVLLSGASPERAAMVAERLRRAVAGHDWRCLGLAAPLTVTIGLASHKGGVADNGADFMRLADMALLAAKDMARDTILHADALANSPSRAEA